MRTGTSKVFDYIADAQREPVEIASEDEADIRAAAVARADSEPRISHDDLMAELDL